MKGFVLRCIIVCISTLRPMQYAPKGAINSSQGLFQIMACCCVDSFLFVAICRRLHCVIVAIATFRCNASFTSNHMSKFQHPYISWPLRSSEQPARFYTSAVLVVTSGYAPNMAWHDGKLIFCCQINCRTLPEPHMTLAWAPYGPRAGLFCVLHTVWAAYFICNKPVLDPYSSNAEYTHGSRVGPVRKKGGHVRYSWPIWVLYRSHTGLVRALHGRGMDGTRALTVLDGLFLY